MKFGHDQQMDNKYYRIFVPELMLVSFHEKRTVIEINNVFHCRENTVDNQRLFYSRHHNQRYNMFSQICKNLATHSNIIPSLHFSSIYHMIQKLMY